MSASSAARSRPQGATLVQAAKAGDFGSVEDLIAAGADVNGATEHGMTALMTAAANGHLKLVSCLLERGADINAKRYDGLDALALAVFFGHLQVVRELLGRGADLKAKSRFGTSAEMWAAARGFQEIAQALTDAKTANCRAALAHQSDESNSPSPEFTGGQEPILSEQIFSDEELSDAITKHPSALVVEKKPSSNYSSYVAKPRYRQKRKSRKLEKCWAYITSGRQRLTVVTLIVMFVCGLGTLAFFKVLSQSNPSRAANSVNVPKPSPPDLPHFSTQSRSTTRSEKIPSTLASEVSGKQTVDSAKRSNDGNGPQADHIQDFRHSRLAERVSRKSAQRVTAAPPKQRIPAKRETPAVSRPAQSFKPAIVSAKGSASGNVADPALENNRAKEPIHAPPALLGSKMERPRTVVVSNDSAAPAVTPGRKTKTKVIQWP
jgi:hypothetical protein